VKKSQWITVGVAILVVATLYRFGRIIPNKKPIQVQTDSQTNVTPITIDTILTLAKKELTTEQVVRLNTLENSISRGDVKDQKLKVYHQLAHFWGDTAGIFEPYAWYEAEAARLENSEKSLTFVARLFLDNLQTDAVLQRRQWKALQAKDLFERSLKLNTDNDSSKIGIGACYLFGDISAMPMEGISKIRQVVDKDSTNIYGQMMLAKGSVRSGQYDKAITRLQTVIRLQPDNIEALLVFADVYERMGDKKNAIHWYQTSLHYINREDIKDEIEKRIKDLNK
jgi:tetratricopeptide (TPR) repeat protein